MEAPQICRMPSRLKCYNYSFIHLNTDARVDIKQMKYARASDNIRFVGWVSVGLYLKSFDRVSKPSPTTL